VRSEDYRGLEALLREPEPPCKTFIGYRTEHEIAQAMGWVRG
jgi:hypothetical protein